MSKYVIEDTTLTNIGDAIRAKTNSSSLLLPENMPDAIRSIETGGEKIVNPKLNDLVFGDYYYTQTILPADGQAYDINIPANVISIMKAQKADMYVTVMRYRYDSKAVARAFPDGRTAYSSGTVYNINSSYPYKQISWFVTMSKESVEATPDGEDYTLCVLTREALENPVATLEVYLFTFPVWGADTVVWRGSFKSSYCTASSSINYPTFRSYQIQANNTASNGQIRNGLTTAYIAGGHMGNTTYTVQSDGTVIPAERWNSKKLIYFVQKVSASTDIDTTASLTAFIIGDDKAFDPFGDKAPLDPQQPNSCLSPSGRVGIFKHSPDRRTLIDAQNNGTYTIQRDGMIVALGLTNSSNNYGMSFRPMELGYKEDQT